MDFVIADLHLGHRSLVEKYKARPFNTLEEMEETIVQKWNGVVSKNDKVYILGDVAWNSAASALIPRLNGCKYVVMGNHDHKANLLMSNGITKVYGALALAKYKVILTHIPVNQQCMDRYSWDFNIHGHLHDGVVYDLEHYIKTGEKIEDPRYMCVSCERVNYTPILIGNLLQDRKNH